VICPAAINSASRCVSVCAWGSRQTHRSSLGLARRSVISTYSPLKGWPIVDSPIAFRGRTSGGRSCRRRTGGLNLQITGVAGLMRQTAQPRGDRRPVMPWWSTTQALRRGASADD
jgi:hypothetical protein